MAHKNKFEPTLNPFTGRSFSSEKEKKAFILEQKQKSKVRLDKIKAKVGARKKALKKFQDFLEAQGIKKNEQVLIFGSRFFE